MIGTPVFTCCRQCKQCSKNEGFILRDKHLCLYTTSLNGLAHSKQKITPYVEKWDLQAFIS